MNPEKLLEPDWENIKLYLDITEGDTSILEKLDKRITPKLEDVMSSFYEHILSVPQTSRFFKDADTVERVKAKQLDYFKKLLHGEYDLKYLKERTKVGVTHDRIGLQLRWYIGAYRKYIQIILQQLYKNHGTEVLPCLDTLIKVVFLDMIAAIESYVGVREYYLKRSEEYFKGIFEATNDAIFLFSPSCTILNANPAALKMLGLSKDDIIGQKCHEVVHGSATRCKETPCTIEAVLRGEDVRGVVHQHYDCHGNAITVEISASAIKNDGGKVIAVVEAARDVTDREMVKMELEERISELERWRRITVDRELRMAELKEENRRLKGELERLKKLCNV